MCRFDGYSEAVRRKLGTFEPSAKAGASRVYCIRRKEVSVQAQTTIQATSSITMPVLAKFCLLVSVLLALNDEDPDATSATPVVTMKW